MVTFSPQNSRLSVLVPVHHDFTAPYSKRACRLHLLEVCLQSIVTARTEAIRSTNSGWAEVNIVVIDDYSTTEIDATWPTLLRRSIRVIRNSGTRGQGGALNYALRQIDCDVFAFTDSDCIVGRDWLLAMKNHYVQHPDHVGIVGPNWYFCDAQRAWSKRLTRAESQLMRYVFESYVNLEQMTVARIDCRSLTFKAPVIASMTKDGRFFTEAKGPSVSGHSSYELLPDLAFSGYTLGFEPEMAVFHHFIESLWPQVITYYRRGLLGDFDIIYSRGFHRLWVAFFERYFKRHFLAPIVSGGVTWWYVVIVHTSFWAGIVVCRFRRNNRKRIRIKRIKGRV